MKEMRSPFGDQARSIQFYQYGESRAQRFLVAQPARPELLHVALGHGRRAVAPAIIQQPRIKSRRVRHLAFELRSRQCRCRLGCPLNGDLAHEREGGNHA